MKKLCLVALLAAVMCFGMTDASKDQHDISLQEAQDLIFKFQEGISPGDRTGGMFLRGAFDLLLAQENAIGVRYYYGLDNSGQRVMVLVAVGADGNDIEDGQIFEKSYPCPPVCAEIRLDDPSLAMK